MTRVAQKDEELFYAREFLREGLQLEVIELKSALGEPPDCAATVKNPNGTTLSLDFESTEYNVDDLRAHKQAAHRKGETAPSREKSAVCMGPEDRTSSDPRRTLRCASVQLKEPVANTSCRSTRLAEVGHSRFTRVLVQNTKRRADDV